VAECHFLGTCSFVQFRESYTDHQGSQRITELVTSVVLVRKYMKTLSLGLVDLNQTNGAQLEKKRHRRSFLLFEKDISEHFDGIEFPNVS